MNVCFSMATFPPFFAYVKCKPAASRLVIKLAYTNHVCILSNPTLPQGLDVPEEIIDDIKDIKENFIIPEAMNPTSLANSMRNPLAGAIHCVTRCQV